MQAPRGRHRWLDFIRLVIVGLLGGVAGGWLDYNSIGDNDAFRALAVRLLAAGVLLVAGVIWATRHSRRARSLALIALVLLVALMVGGWVAPSAHPIGWSLGSAHVDLSGGMTRDETLTAECNTNADTTTFDLWSASMLDSTLTDRLRLGLSIQTAAPLTGGAIPEPFLVSLDIGVGGYGNAQEFSYNVERRTTTASAQGTPQSGHLDFADLPVLVRSDPGLLSDLPTLSGTVDWTCGPPAMELTPVAGSWFH